MRLISFAAAILVGTAAGCVFSDYALQTGFPHQRYELKIRYDGTAESAFSCTQLANRLDLGNMSEFDPSTKVQRNCFVDALGSQQRDGSFDAVTYPHLWLGRVLHRGKSFHLKNSQIESIRLAPRVSISDFVGDLLGITELP